MSDVSCAWEVMPGSRYVDPEPPTFCDADPVEGSEYCGPHLAAVSKLEDFAREDDRWDF